jgi:hypothetical protein
MMDCARRTTSRFSWRGAATRPASEPSPTARRGDRRYRGVLVGLSASSSCTAPRGRRGVSACTRGVCRCRPPHIERGAQQRHAGGCVSHSRHDASDGTRAMSDIRLFSGRLLQRGPLRPSSSHLFLLPSPSSFRCPLKTGPKVVAILLLRRSGCTVRRPFSLVGHNVADKDVFEASDEFERVDAPLREVRCACACVRAPARTRADGTLTSVSPPPNHMSRPSSLRSATRRSDSKIGSSGNAIMRCWLADWPWRLRAHPSCSQAASRRCGRTQSWRPTRPLDTDGS